METQAKKGTTTVGICFKDGIVIAADKRASMGHLAAHKVDKVLKVTNNLALATAGMVADLQTLYKYLKAEMELYSLDKDAEPTVEVAASLLSTILYGGRKSFFPYMVGLIIGGKSIDGFKIHSIESAGSSIVDEYMSWGSGMELAYGVLESRYKKDMTKDQAVNLAVESVHTAIKRDIASGGGIDVVVIDKNGYNKVREIDIPSILKEK